MQPYIEMVFPYSLPFFNCHHPCEDTDFHDLLLILDPTLKDWELKKSNDPIYENINCTPGRAICILGQGILELLSSIFGGWHVVQLGHHWAVLGIMRPSTQVFYFPWWWGWCFIWRWGCSNQTGVWWVQEMAWWKFPCRQLYHSIFQSEVSQVW